MNVDSINMDKNIKDDPMFMPEITTIIESAVDGNKFEMDQGLMWIYTPETTRKIFEILCDV